MPNIVAKHFEKKCIGKFVSNSKEELIWKLEIDGIMTLITLKLSHLSRKFEVFVNGLSKKIGTEVFGSINIDFKHLNCLFILESDFKTSKLKINGTNFDNLYWRNDSKKHLSPNRPAPKIFRTFHFYLFFISNLLLSLKKKYYF